MESLSSSRHRSGRVRTACARARRCVPATWCCRGDPCCIRLSWASWRRSDGRRCRSCPGRTVAIVPTGDELVEPGETPGPGQIRNSNAVMLRATGEANAGAAADTLPIAPRRAVRLARILEQGARGRLPARDRRRLGRPARPRAGTLESLGVRQGLPQGPPEAGQAALVRGRPPRRRPTRGAGLRAAGQPGQRAGRISCCSSGRPSRPSPGSAGRLSPSAGGQAARAGSLIAAIAPPTFLRGSASADEPAARLALDEPSTGRVRPTCARWPRRRLCRLCRPATATTAPGEIVGFLPMR